MFKTRQGTLCAPLLQWRLPRVPRILYSLVPFRSYVCGFRVLPLVLPLMQRHQTEHPAHKLWSRPLFHQSYAVRLFSQAEWCRTSSYERFDLCSEHRGSCFPPSLLCIVYLSPIHSSERLSVSMYTVVSSAGVKDSLCVLCMTL